MRRTGSQPGDGKLHRDSKEVVTEPDVIYRPYNVQSKQGDPVAIIFDVVISDKVGFTYSGVNGTMAAKDFIDRIHAIRSALVESGAEGPTWYRSSWMVKTPGNTMSDGKEFLNSLYAGLSDDPLIKTVTPSEFLTIAPEPPKLDDLWAGSWINHDFTTWIGEEEENQAWEYLTTTREFLQLYLSGTRQAEDEALKQALNFMYIAEGSDWFWWFGSDQSSSTDEAFDAQFRNTLKQVYVSLGAPVPEILEVPVIPITPVAADVSASGLITVTVNGVEGEGEWDAAGVYLPSGGVMAGGEPYFKDLAYGFAAKELFIKVSAMNGTSADSENETIEIYFNHQV
jgi:alpha-amylase/alpha-mannosidase (GH57 family)